MSIVFSVLEVFVSYMSSILRVNNLFFHHISAESVIKAVDGVSFSIERGEFVAIVGPSGSGKSTLLSLLAGLEQPQKGEIWFNESALHTMSEQERCRFRRNDLGFVFQSFQLFDNYTALENVQFLLELQGRLSSTEIRRQAKQLLEQVGLGERLHHYPKQLSGGEQQRVALARAFAAQPTLLLADEPTGNLDHETGNMVVSSLLALKKELKTTVVLVTHDRELAIQADRILMMKRGQLQESLGVE